MPDELEALLAQLRGAFPAAEVQGLDHDDTGLALPAERGLTQPMVPSRAAEFLTGRTLARRALRALGVADEALLPTLHRYPRWPGGTVGSISHSHGVRVAVVAREADYWAVGVDVERREAVTAELASIVATDEERERFAGRPDALTELFSAKEAVFKATFPRTHVWLEFHDVSILELDDLGFVARLHKSPGWTLAGWRRAAGSYIVSCVLLTRAPNAEA